MIEVNRELATARLEHYTVMIILGNPRIGAIYSAIMCREAWKLKKKYDKEPVGDAKRYMFMHNFYPVINYLLVGSVRTFMKMLTKEFNENMKLLPIIGNSDRERGVTMYSGYIGNIIRSAISKVVLEKDYLPMRVINFINSLEN